MQWNLKGRALHWPNISHIEARTCWEILMKGVDDVNFTF